MPTPAPLPVFLTVDVGPDDAVLGHEHEHAARWERTEAGLVALADCLRAGVDGPVRATWFVRADRHVAATEGDALAVFARFASFLREREGSGDCVGWMPQAYASGAPGVDYDDLAATARALHAAGWPVRATRMGGCFHDDRSMAVLDDLGIAIDCSALPGRQKSDGGWRLDWRGTPGAAYHPGRADYRRPGSPALDVLELPVSMLPIRADYDREPLLRYLNPAMHPDRVAPGLDALVVRAPYLQALVHPDELVPPAHGRGHPLVAYAPEAFAQNLAAWVARAREHGREPVFATVDRAVALFGPDAASRRAEAR